MGAEALRQLLAAFFHPTDSPVGQALEGAKAFYTALPSLPIFIGHCLYCTTLGVETRKHFLLNYWLTFLAGFAGGPLSALLIMRPDKAPINFMGSNRSGITWALVWWSTTYSPAAPTLQRIIAWKPFKALTRASVGFMRASSITARVVLVDQLYPGVIMGPIVAGTVSACAGKSTYDAIRHVYGLSAGSPAEFTVPTYSFRSAFLGASFIYWAAVHPATRFLTANQASAVLITLFVAHALLSELTGRPLDWSEGVLHAVLRLVNIPWPSGVPLPLPSKPCPAALPAVPPLVHATKAALPAAAAPASKGHHPTRAALAASASAAAAPAQAAAKALGAPWQGLRQADEEGATQQRADKEEEQPQQLASREVVGSGVRKQGGQDRRSTGGSGGGDEVGQAGVEPPSVEAIRAALQQSAKAGGRAADSGGGKKSGTVDGEWQVVPTRGGKKTAAAQGGSKQPTADGKKNK